MLTPKSCEGKFHKALQTVAIFALYDCVSKLVIPAAQIKLSDFEKILKWINFIHHNI